MRIRSTTGVVIMTLAAVWACSGLGAQSMGSESTSSPQQLLSEIMSCDESHLVQFVEHHGTSAVLRAQFDQMIENLDQLDEEQLLGLVKRGFDNGWPTHVVSGLFSKALMHSWAKRPPDANSVCTQIADKTMHPGCKLFIIQGAQRNWSQAWSEGDFIRFTECVVKYASDTNINYRLRSPVVDDLLRSAKKHLSGNAPKEAKSQMRCAVRIFILSALENAKSDTKEAYALVRDSLRGYEVMQVGNGNVRESTGVALTNMAYLLMNTNTSVHTAREILQAQKIVDLSTILKPEDVKMLRADRRFVEPSDQEMVQALSLSIAGRKHP